MTPKEVKRLVHDASVAHCDLNIFYAIIALAENSLISATHSRGCERIIKICKAESHKALIRYDRHVAKLTERPVLPDEGKQK